MAVPRVVTVTWGTVVRFYVCFEGRDRTESLDELDVGCEIKR